jgi:hypothetical protein
MSPRRLPSPKTVCVARAYKEQRVHVAASRRSAAIVVIAAGT